MARIIFRISSLGLFFIGISSYFSIIPWPFNCRTKVCSIGTTIISLEIAFIIVGVLLFLLSFILTKKRVKR
jgi:hypothetical protein